MKTGEGLEMKNEMQTNITQLGQADDELENEVTWLDQEIIDIIKKDQEKEADENGCEKEEATD